MASQSDTIESLVLAVAMNTQQVNKALKALERDTAQTANKITKNFDNVVPFERTQQSFARSSKAMANDAKVLSFQFNDLFTQIASGTSVTQALNQQMGQIGQSFAGIKNIGAGASLVGQALMGMVPTLALTAAFTAITYAAQQFFDSTEKGTKEALEDAQKQAAEIDKIADTWKDKATPALKAYIEGLQEAAKKTVEVAASNDLIAKAFEPAKASLEGMDGDIQEIQSLLQTADFEKFGQLATDLGSAYDAVLEKTRKNLPATKEMQTLQELILKAQQSQIPAVDTFAASISNKVVPALNEALRISKEVAKSFEGAQFGPWQMKGPADFQTLSPLGSADVMGAVLKDNAAAAASARELSDSLGAASGEITKFVDNVIKAESGGRANAKNPNSSAFGAGQFLKSTWLEVFKRNFANEAAGMSDAAILALRGNIDVNRSMIRAYATENAKALISAGQTVNEAALQLAHFLGSGGAVKVLKSAPGTRIADIPGMGAAVAANPSVLGGGATREDVIAYANRRAEANVKVKKSIDDITLSSRQQIELQQKEAVLNADTTLKESERLYQLDKLRITMQLTNQAKAEGVELDAKARAEIDATATSLARQAQQQREVATAAKERARASAEAAQTAEQLVSAGLTTFVSELRAGASAADALRSALNRVLDVVIQLAINSISKGFGGLFATAHSGGTVGSLGANRRVNPLVFAGAPRMHSGGLVPGEVPIIAQKGEVVLPRGALKRGNGAGSLVSTSLGDVNIDMSQSGVVAADNATAKQFGVNVQKLIQAEMVRESRPGGLLRRV